MCQRVGRDLLVALEDIVGYKVVRRIGSELNTYQSEWPPSRRSVIDPDSGDVSINPDGRSLGSDIAYSVGATIHSSGGPGIFFHKDVQYVTWSQALLKVRVPAGTKYRLCSYNYLGPLGDCFAAETIIVEECIRKG